MIGIFDSGVGGLTVVKEIFKYLPEYQIIYFGDTARLPYGTKGAGFVQKYSAKITNWLLDRKAKIIIIACHTASSWASVSLKNKFKKIPIFEMISAGAKDAAVLTKNGKIGIIGTPGTIKSRAFENKVLKINPDAKIYTAACSLFVPLVEMGFVEGDVTKKVIEEYLSPLKGKGIDTLVLACTHYPLLEKEIKNFMGVGVNIVNPAESLAKDLKNYFESNPKIEKQLKRGAAHQFYFSDEPYNLEKISQLCFGKIIKVKIKDPF